MRLMRISSQAGMAHLAEVQSKISPGPWTVRHHFETLIPWLTLCNARARRAGEGIGHTVHEVTTRSCPFARLQVPVLRGLFSWRRSQKNSPSKGIAGTAE